MCQMGSIDLTGHSPLLLEWGCLNINLQNVYHVTDCILALGNTKMKEGRGTCPLGLHSITEDKKRA